MTTFFLKHEIDTGDILRQERITIGPDENVGSVHDRLMELGAELTVDTVQHILKGDLTPMPQDKLLGDEEPTPAPKIFKDTCRIDWHRPARKVHDFVRGLSPYPAAWSEIHGDTTAPTEVKIFETRVLDEKVIGIPGTVLVKGDSMYVQCEPGQVEIVSLRPAGKKQMPAADYLRGARLVNPLFK